MNKIILTTLNARYIHTSIALKYLYANLGELREQCEILEFVINDNLTDAAEKILSRNPQIVGISVYIWNASEVKRLINILKKISPDTVIVLGGPEVSHLPLRVDFNEADYIIQGEGDFTFYHLCNSIINQEKKFPAIIHSDFSDLTEINLPYRYYTDEDIRNRIIYVEASRGCPFNCQFCLSSLDKTVRYFDLDKLLTEFEELWNRGARNFKFIDRTFNLNLKVAQKILDFFLSKTENYFVHFEVIPEHFPDAIKEKIKLFPPASLQLEVGIQTLNPETAKRINRNLNFEKIKTNLHYLETETRAHLHVDLIVGLPGESLKEFEVNLNTLTNLTDSEIQIGFLKKLSGTAIDSHDEQYAMIYSDNPPYEILQNNLISFGLMQKMKRFARFWDLTYNSGDFYKTVRLLWENGQVFEEFFSFSEWVYSQTLSTWHISLDRMAELMFVYLTDVKGRDKNLTADIIVKDILKVSGRRVPRALRNFTSVLPEEQRKNLGNSNKRQIKHT